MYADSTSHKINYRSDAVEAGKSEATVIRCGEGTLRTGLDTQGRCAKSAQDLWNATMSFTGEGTESPVVSSTSAASSTT